MTLRNIRLLALYFIVPAVGIVTPFVVFPALTLRFGAPGLAAIGVAQSLGGAGGVISELGWGVVGPQRVAQSHTEERRSLYESALASKYIATAIMGPVAALCAYFLVEEFKFPAAIIAFAVCLSALSPSWYLIGCNRPLTILYVESFPRLILVVIAALIIRGGGPLQLYGWAMIISSAITILLTSRVVGQSVLPSANAFARAPGVVRNQLPLTAGRSISVVYTSLTITLVSIANPAATATFTAVERLMRMALGVLAAVPSRLQSWVGGKNGAERIERSRKSLLFNSLLGLVSAIAFASLAPTIGSYVFSGSVIITFTNSALSSCVLFVVCVSRGFGLSLVAEGRANWIAGANLGAAVAGVCATYSLAARWGTNGAILGELAAEVVGLLVQATILFGFCLSSNRRKARGGLCRLPR